MALFVISVKSPGAVGIFFIIAQAAGGIHGRRRNFYRPVAVIRHGDCFPVLHIGQKHKWICAADQIRVSISAVIHCQLFVFLRRYPSLIPVCRRGVSALKKSLAAGQRGVSRACHRAIGNDPRGTHRSICGTTRRLCASSGNHSNQRPRGAFCTYIGHGKAIGGNGERTSADCPDKPTGAALLRCDAAGGITVDNGGAAFGEPAQKSAGILFCGYRQSRKGIFKGKGRLFRRIAN